MLVVNAGSSSLKLRVVDAHEAVIGECDLPADAGRVPEARLREALAPLPAADAVGHRVVHGGGRSGPARIDPDLMRELASLAELAPLHQPAALAIADAVGRLLPGTPAVACFDTAFHAGLPAAAATYALPRAWRTRWPLRRHGFHGLSHAHVSRRAAELLGRPAEDLLVVSCHLGAGASLCAIDGGRSVDTTMGLTPMEGLVMATRPGDVDPGLLLWLLRDGRLQPEALEDGLVHGSGLLGLCGTADMRTVLERAGAGDAEARLALEVYIRRLRAGIAAMAAALDGLDALVFTGGVGEHAAGLRERACAGLGFLGVGLDDRRNAAATADAEIGADGAPVRALVVAAREDLEISRGVRAALGAAGR